MIKTGFPNIIRPKVTPKPWGSLSDIQYALRHNCENKLGISYDNIALALPLWDGTGNRPIDYSRHGNCGTNHDATWKADGLNFDGNDYVNVPEIPAYDITTPNLTLIAQVNFNSLNSGNWEGLVAKWNGGGGGSGYGYGLFKHNSSGDVSFITASSSGSGYADAQANSNPTLHKWYHVIGTFDGTTMKLYLDGVQQTDTGTQSSIYNNSEPITIGVFESNYTDSIIKNINVLDVNLTQRQIELLTNQPWLLYEPVSRPTYFHGTDFLYSGDIITTLTPESTYYADHVYSGDITTILTPESTYLATINYEYSGDVTVNLTPESTYEGGYKYSGDITTILTPESTYLTSMNYSYSGDVIISLTPESGASVKDFTITGSGGIKISGDGDIVHFNPNYFVVESEYGIIGGVSVGGMGIESFTLPPEYSVVGDGGVILDSKGSVVYSYPKCYSVIASGGINVNHGGIVEFVNELPIFSIVGSGGVVISGRGICEHTGVNDLLNVAGCGGVKIKGAGGIAFTLPSTHNITSIAKIKISGTGVAEFSYPVKTFEAIAAGGIKINSNGFTIFSIPPILNVVGSGGLVIDRPIDDTTVYHTWVINGTTFEPAVYSGFNFNSYAVYNGKAYGLKDDGLYLLEGDTDDSTQINTGIDFGEKNFGGTGRKKLRSIRVINDESNTKIKVSDGIRDGYYDLDSNNKATISRKIRGKKINIKIADFNEIDTMAMEVVRRGY